MQNSLHDFVEDVQFVEDVRLLGPQRVFPQALVPVRGDPFPGGGLVAAVRPVEVVHVESPRVAVGSFSQFRHSSRRLGRVRLHGVGVADLHFPTGSRRDAAGLRGEAVHHVAVVRLADCASLPVERARALDDGPVIHRYFAASNPASRIRPNSTTREYPRIHRGLRCRVPKL